MSFEEFSLSYFCHIMHFISRDSVIKVMIPTITCTSIFGTSHRNEVSNISFY